MVTNGLYYIAFMNAFLCHTLREVNITGGQKVNLITRYKCVQSSFQLSMELNISGNIFGGSLQFQVLYKTIGTCEVNMLLQI